MEKTPLSPDIKVRDLTAQPRTPVERATLLLLQAGQGLQVMADKAQALVADSNAPMVVKTPKFRRDGAPAPEMPAEWRRRVAVEGMAAERKSRNRLPNGGF